jgi:ribosomal protein S18 acetylase RimI-like enzyme
VLIVENVTIRKADASELDQIIKMHLSLQGHLENSNSCVWRYTEAKKRSLKQQYVEHLMDENSLVLVAEVDAKVVGFLLATVSHRAEYLPSIVASLSSIYVGRSYRRRGIGSRLIGEACRFFSLKKAKRIYVRYVLGNKEGEGFWKYLKFNPIIVTAEISASEIDDRMPNQ